MVYKEYKRKVMLGGFNLEMRKYWLLIVAVIVGIAILTFFFFGFNLTPQSREGKRIFEEYLAKNHPNANIISVNDVTTTHYNPKGGRYKYDSFDYVSDYVEGYYSIGKDKYKFYVNVKTGEIYTSEKYQEIQTKLVNTFKSLLGLEWESSKIIFNTFVRKHIRGNDTLALRGVFSSELKDVTAIEDDLFKNKDREFALTIYYKGKDIDKSYFDHIRKIKSAGRSYLDIIHFSDSIEKEAFNSDDIGKLNRTSARKELASFCFDNGAVWYEKWADCNDYSPLVLHYLNYCKEKRFFNGNENVREEFYNIHNDLRIEVGDNSYSFFPLNDKLDFDILFTDISLFENERQVSIVNLLSKEDYVKKYYNTHKINPLYLSQAQKNSAESSFEDSMIPKKFELKKVSEGWVLFDKIDDINYYKALKYFKLQTGKKATKG